MWSNLLLFGKEMFFSLPWGLTLFLGVVPYISLIFLNLATYHKLKTIQAEELTENVPARAIQQVVTVLVVTLHIT